MSKKTTNQSNSIYQIKIILHHIEPAIWRRLLVKADTCLGDLHCLIQVIMGWEDEHMHEFNINKCRYGIPDPEYPSDVEDEDDFILQDIIKSGDKFIYEYDFGDGWRHLLKVEKVITEEQDTFYPVCTDGARACPPEDCGGFPGYMRILEIMKDPDNEEYEEMKEWIGEDYDPEKIDLEEINQGLKQLYQK